MDLERWRFKLRMRLRSIFHRAAVEQDLEDELGFHLQQRMEEEIAAGREPAQARRAALRAMDGMEQRREECRDVRRLNLIDNLLQDVRYGARALGKSRMFTIAAVLTLALGMSVNATIFSLISGWVLRPPAVTDPNRVVTLLRANARLHVTRGWVSARILRAWQEGNRAFTGMTAALPDNDLSITGGGDPERLSGMRVTAPYFDVLGVKPLLGRTFLPGEDQPGHERVIVLSYVLWQQRFAADPKVVGRTVELDGDKYTVIGVMPATAFRLMTHRTRIWMPLVIPREETSVNANDGHYYMIFARLQPGVAMEQARADLDTLLARQPVGDPATARGWTSVVMTLQEYGIQEINIRRGLILLMTAVVLVLLIACGNVANLLLARGSGRQQEIAIRTALGAARGRVVRHLLTESLLIAVLGGIAGLVLAHWGIELLRNALHFNVDMAEMATRVGLDGRVLAFTALVSMATAVLFGLAPALRISANDPQTTLRHGGRGGDMRRGWGRRVLVGGEIALAVVLLTGASLAMKATENELAGDDGYDSRRVLALDLALTNPRYHDPMRRAAFVRDVLDKCRELPGVQAAAATNSLPLDADETTFSILGKPAVPVTHRPRAKAFAVTPEYLQVLGVSVLQGRAFRESDTGRTDGPAIVNRAFVRRFFAGQQAIGRYINVDDGAEGSAPVWREIVGIVPDLSAGPQARSREDDPQVYEARFPSPADAVNFVVRAAGDADLLAAGLRRAVWAVDKNQPVGEIATIARRVHEMQGGDMVISTLMSIFGVMALALAGIGIYGVIAYAVAQRTHEIGIRMALGARRAQVVRWVVTDGMIPGIAGAAVGLTISAPLPRLFSSFFAGWSVHSAPIFTAVATAVLLVTLGAVYVPALRAVRIDPGEALRHE
jgi:predicted permease